MCFRLPQGEWELNEAIRGYRKRVGDKFGDILDFVYNKGGRSTTATSLPQLSNSASDEHVPEPIQRQNSDANAQNFARNGDAKIGGRHDRDSAMASFIGETFPLDIDFTPASNTDSEVCENAVRPEPEATGDASKSYWAPEFSSVDDFYAKTLKNKPGDVWDGVTSGETDDPRIHGSNFERADGAKPQYIIGVKGMIGKPSPARAGRNTILEEEGTRRVTL